MLFFCLSAIATVVGIICWYYSVKIRKELVAGLATNHPNEWAKMSGSWKSEYLRDAFVINSFISQSAPLWLNQKERKMHKYINILGLLGALLIFIGVIGLLALTV